MSMRDIEDDRGLDRVDDLLYEIAEVEKQYDQLWADSAPKDDEKPNAASEE